MANLTLEKILKTRHRTLAASAARINGYQSETLGRFFPARQGPWHAAAAAIRALGSPGSGNLARGRRFPFA
jgi:hypothetical protein